jgi:hypothetical protein
VCKALIAEEGRMPRSERTAAAAKIVDDASSSTLVLVEELAAPLAEYMLADYGVECWRRSPIVEALARAATILEAADREVPGSILVALRKATEAGRTLEWNDFQVRCLS